MKITKWMGAFGRGMARQLYCACIERCGLIAGSACCGDAVATLLRDEALLPGR